MKKVVRYPYSIFFKMICLILACFVFAIDVTRKTILWIFFSSDISIKSLGQKISFYNSYQCTTIKMLKAYVALKRDSERELSPEDWDW